VTGAAAFAFPLCLAVVTNAFPQAKVERAVGTVFGIAAVGQAFGPLIGGGLTAVFNWRAVLLVNVPVSLVLIVLAYASIHESRDETMPKDIDWFGLGLIVTSISAFTYAVDRASDLGWTSASTLGLMVVGVIGVVVFIVVAVFAGLGFGMSWAFTRVPRKPSSPRRRPGRRPASCSRSS
jgi:MFS family permease